MCNSVPLPCRAAAGGRSGPGGRAPSSKYAAAPEGSAAPVQSDQGALSGGAAALGAAIDPGLMMRRSARRAGLPVDAVASPAGSCEWPVRLGASSQDAQPAATESGPPSAAEVPVCEHTAPSAVPGAGSAAVQGGNAGTAVPQHKQSRCKRKRAGQQTAAQPDAAPSVPALGQPGSALKGVTPAAQGTDVPAQLPEGEPSATKRQRTRRQQVSSGRAPVQPACSRNGVPMAEVGARSRQQPGCGEGEVPLGTLDAEGRQLPGRRDDEEMPLGQLAALRRQLPGDVPLGQLAAAQQLLTSAEAARHSVARGDLAGQTQEGGMAMQASRIRRAIPQCQGGAASGTARAAPVPSAAAAEHGRAMGAAVGEALPALHAAATAQEHCQPQVVPMAAATHEPGQAEGPPAVRAPYQDQLPACNTVAAGHTPARGGRNRGGEREGREGAQPHSEEATASGELESGDGC